MLIGKSLLDNKNFFSPNYYKKNDKVIKKCFLWMVLKMLGCKKSVVLRAKSIKNLKILKQHILFIKHYFLLVFVTSAEVKMNKYLTKNNQLKH